MNFVTKAWHGEEKLWFVFWVCGFGGGLALNILAMIIMMILGAANGAILTAILWVVFSTWYIVSVWRCAFNADMSLWGYIARAVMILNFIGLVMMIFGLFAAKEAGVDMKMDNGGITIQKDGEEVSIQQSTDGSGNVVTTYNSGGNKVTVTESSKDGKTTTSVISQPETPAVNNAPVAAPAAPTGSEAPAAQPMAPAGTEAPAVQPAAPTAQPAAPTTAPTGTEAPMTQPTAPAAK